MLGNALHVDRHVLLRKDADGRTTGRVGVVIRPDDVGDVLALLDLADRAGAPVPAGPLLVAEVDTVLRAASCADGSGPIADGAFPCAVLVELLAERGERDRLPPFARRRRRWRERIAQWERLWTRARLGEREQHRLEVLRASAGRRVERPAP